MNLDRNGALELLKNGDLIELGTWADKVRMRLHPNKDVSFVVDRNVNYTNVCECRCSFCAFYRTEDSPDAYLLDKSTILSKIQELVDRGGTQLLMQGGLHPQLKLTYFEELFRSIKQHYPMVQNHSLSPAEVCHLADREGLSIDDTIGRLQAAGLDSIPGGGAEILVDEVRKTISPNKIGWRRWGDVMIAASKKGMSTTATMMFGSTETPEQIIEHIFRVKELQAEGGSFTAFIPWTYQPGNTELGGTTATGVEYLKVLALSRIILDTIPNIQASWVTQGAKLAQIALFFGANDMGGTMLEENVVAAAGCSFRMSQDEMVDLIRSAGFTPVQRTTGYRPVRRFE
jgi:cyclic dehypoxanthinyl futalosine synthase